MLSNSPRRGLLVGLLLAGSLLGCTLPGSGSDPGRGDTLPPPDTEVSPHRPSSPAPSPTRTPNLEDRCAAVVEKLELKQQVGQLFMAAVSSEGLSEADGSALRRSDVGSVILLGNTTAGVSSVAEVTAAARRAAGAQSGIEPLLAADQEGGRVQRLRGDGFDRIPSALEQAELSDAELARQAKSWGAQLRRAGIGVNLAPVADLVPDDLRDANEPIGRLERGYGSDRGRVARKVVAFVSGMDAAGVATAVKHFPGLGKVRGNTDFEADVVDRQTRRHDRDLSGFRAAVEAGVDLVMIASASYRRIDRDHRAAYSSTVMEMVRDDLEFDGVIISDDLAAVAFADVAIQERALRYFKAGGDLAIVGDTALVAGMARAVIAEAEDDRDFAAEVAAKATRVVALKARRGLARC